MESNICVICSDKLKPFDEIINVKEDGLKKMRHSSRHQAIVRTDKIKISCCCHGNQRWDLTFMACLVFYYLYKIVLKSCDCIIL